MTSGRKDPSARTAPSLLPDIFITLGLIVCVIGLAACRDGSIAAHAVEPDEAAFA